jgi:hypothetical protein
MSCGGTPSSLKVHLWVKKQSTYLKYPSDKPDCVEMGEKIKRFLMGIEESLQKQANPISSSQIQNTRVASMLLCPAYGLLTGVTCKFV